MGKSRKRLAVLLAATMAISMMTGFTSFAADGEPQTGGSIEIVDEGDNGDTGSQETTVTITTSDSTTPTTPTEPTTPTTPTEPTEPTEPVEPTEPAEPTEPTVPAEPTAPTEPAEPTEPTEPAGSTTPTEPIEPAESTEPTEPTTPTEPVTTTEPAAAPATLNLTTADNDLTENDETYEITTQSEPAEEEPETVVKIAGDQIKEKDEFVPLGEGKGEYKYYDGTLILKDVVIEIEPEYGGAAIVVQGTLVIELEGDNYLTTSGGTVISADLYDEDPDKENTFTITGDGSLTLSNKGDGKIDENKSYGDGIYVYSGDLIIDGAEVTSDIYNSGYCAAIWVNGGDVEIKNGADVTAKSTAVENNMEHFGIYAGGGKISVTGDSDVYASADGDMSDAARLIAEEFDLEELKITDPRGWYDLLTYFLSSAMWDDEGNLINEDAMAQVGIGMYSSGATIKELLEDYQAGIIIDDSNVRSIGSFASMLVTGLDGTIKINDSTIVSPDDVNIRELIAVIDDDPDAAAVVIGAILAKGEGPVDIDAIMEEIEKIYEEDGEEGLEAYLTELFDSIAKDVNIVRDAELQAQKAGLGIGDGVPTTGDNFQAEGLLIAMFAASVAIVYCIRRKVSA